MYPVTIVPRSLEPTQVNVNQGPVFSLRVSNETDAEVDVLPSTKLWITDDLQADRGFSPSLDSSVTIPAHREALLRFQPTRIEMARINAGVFPIRIDFAIRKQGVECTWTTVSENNFVRIGSNGGIEPVESIETSVPDEPIIVSRSGGYFEVTIVMKDMFPVDLRLRWRDRNPAWTALTDDGIDFDISPEVLLRQTRASVRAGVWISPSAAVPVNVVQSVGRLIAERCPVLAGAGAVPCLASGGRIRAVIAESAEVQMQICSPVGPLSVPAGGAIDIQATLVNPFNYKVDLANYDSRIPHADATEPSTVSESANEGAVLSRDPVPLRAEVVGVRTLQGATVVSDVFFLEAMIAPDYLQPTETVSVTWRLRVDPTAKQGRYNLQPFTTATVWLSDRFGIWPKLECKIDPCANNPDCGVEVDVSE